MTENGGEPTIDVVAAVIKRHGRYLICQRAAHKRHGGRWEFPGGKVRPGESQETAVHRELDEELGVQVTRVGETLFAARDPGSPFRVVFRDVGIAGAPAPNEHSEIAWCLPAQLRRFAFAPCDERFVREVLGILGERESELWKDESSVQRTWS